VTLLVRTGAMQIGMLFSLAVAPGLLAGEVVKLSVLIAVTAYCASISRSLRFEAVTSMTWALELAGVAVGRQCAQQEKRAGGQPAAEGDGGPGTLHRCSPVSGRGPRGFVLSGTYKCVQKTWT
jgi:hypothetical protein